MSFTHDALAKPARPWGGWALCLLLAAFGFACHGIIMVTNFVQGSTSGIVYAYLAGAVDFGGVGLCSILAGHMARRGNRTGSFALILLALISALISLVMFFGYNASHRDEPTKLAARQHSAELTAATQSVALQVAAAERIQATLEKEMAKAAEVARKRAGDGDTKTTAADQLKFYTEQMKEASKIEIKAAPIEVDPDAMASQLSARSGLKIDVVQDLIGTALSLMGMVLGSVMLFLSNYLWPERRTPAEIRAATAAEKDVMEWEKEATIRMPGARHRSTEVYKHYQRYAKYRGWELIMAREKFERTLTDLRHTNRSTMRHIAEGTYVLYEDRQLDYRPVWANVVDPVSKSALAARASRRAARRQRVIQVQMAEEQRPTIN